MQTNKIFSLIAAVALTLSVSAQQSVHDNYVGVSFGGGLNSMLYNPANGQQSVGAGIDAGLFYSRFFNEWIGLGVGAQFSWANAYTTYNWNEVTNGLTHPDNPNTPYNLTTGFDHFKERQNIGVFSIPVEVLFRKAFNDRVVLIGGVGLSLDLPVYGKYIAKSGSYSTTGVFPEAGSYVFEKMPEHGFSTYSTTQNAKVKNLAKVGVGLVADLGTRIALHDNWGLYCGIYIGYGFTNLLASSKVDEMIMINSIDPAKIDYRGTFDSNQSGKANLIRCGVKVAVDFGWSKKVKEVTPEPVLEPAPIVDEEAERLAAEKAARERLEAERIARERAAAEEAARLASEHAAHIAALKAKGETVTVHFETAGTEMQFKDGEQAIVDEIAEVMAAQPDLRIIITGHTDNTGDAEQNLKIWGAKRAEVLKAYMVEKGVNPDQIRCESKGQNEPLADNATREGRALNRRANIRFE